MNEAAILSISRPHPKLQTLYVIHSILSGPGIVVSLPLLLFRYHTLRYKFDTDGISMSWGLLFKKQVTLSYSRIQDIHLESGIIQRWLGLADIQIQTASGSSDAEMSIEGLLEYEAIRDFLYSKMRGYKAAKPASQAPPPAAALPQEAAAQGEAELLKELLQELSAARAAAERIPRKEA